ncbi:MAG: T9SS type A sorting domain-containing protein [Bacteroidetes bacterium]|nr:T9SS type A sorting domain-containing protein [Bacteroidota bacterium]
MIKKILFSLLATLCLNAYGQYSTNSVAPVVLPSYMAGSQGGSHALPVLFKLRIIGMAPNNKYKYVVRGMSAADMASTNLFAGAGNGLYPDTGGIWRYVSGTPSFANNNHDTFTTSGGGEYEGWFGLVATNDSRFNAGKAIYPGLTIIGIGNTDTFRVASIDSMRVLSFSTSNAADTSCTGIYGKSMGTDRNLVALYNNNTGMGRPLNVTYIENEKVNIPNLVSFYSNVEGKSGYWAAIMPNTNSFGIRRIEQISLKTNLIVYANNDGDGIWGPSSKSTINPTGGRTSPVSFDENDAALTPPMVEYWTGTSTKKENDGAVEVYVVRKYSNDQAQSVRIFVAGNTATKNADYTIASDPKTITFKASGAQANDTTKITITDDQIHEGDETIVLSMDNASNCVIGANKAHTMTIKDNDTAYISVKKKTEIVKESAGKVGITVKIDKAVGTPSQLRLRVKSKGFFTNIPAEYKLGQNNTDSVITLGKTTGPDSVTIYARVIDESNPDADDSVILVVRPITGVARLKDSLCTQIMQDNDGPCHIKFLNKTATAKEPDGTLKVRILLVKKTDAGGDFSLRYISSASSAQEGVRFTYNPTSKIFNIDNTTPDTIDVSVPLINDNIYQPTQNIMWGLGSLNNVTILKPDSFNVTLLNDDLPLYKIGTIRSQNSTAKTPDSSGVRCRISGTVYGGNLSGNGVEFTLRDNTGGILVSNLKKYGYNVTEGDSLLISGTVLPNNGLPMFGTLDTIIKIAGSRPLNAVSVVTTLNESTESRLIQKRRVKLVNPAEWPSSALSANSGKYVRIQTTSGVTDSLYIDAETDLDGTTAPTGYLNVTGIGGQSDPTAPHTVGYTICPRKLTDITPASLPVVKFAKVRDTITELADSFRMDFNIAPTDENFSYDIAIQSSSTAQNPRDYNWTTRTINVIKNNSFYTTKCNISDDVVSDGDQTLVFVIRNINGPGSVGTDSALTLVILDNEPKIGVKTFADGQIRMYPNPAAQKVFLRSPVQLGLARILAIDGREVAASNIAGNQTEINIQHLKPGMYMVQVTTLEGDTYTESLMIR